MFSKAERRFLEAMISGDLKGYSKKYSEVLRYRIRRKMKTALGDLDLAAKAFGITSLQKIVVALQESVESYKPTQEGFLGIKPRAGFEPATCGLQGRRSTS